MAAASIALVLAALSTLGLAGDAAAGAPPRLNLPGGSFGARVWAPAGAEGEALPTVLFVSGAGGLTSPLEYGQLINRLTAKGFVVVGLDRQASIDYPKAGREFYLVMDWAQRPGSDGLAAAMVQQRLGVVPDTERIALMGHSSGNHILGEALVRGCGPAKAWVMIDPVDGFDPYRFVKSQDLITPGQKLSFIIPSLMLRNGLDPKSVGPLFPACAPEAISNDRFYNAMRGPIWAVNATEYGHVDCCDSQSFVCPTDSTTDKAAYKEMLANASATFLGALFGIRSHSDLRSLEEPDFFNFSVVLNHELNGVSREGVGPGCINGGSESYGILFS